MPFAQSSGWADGVSGGEVQLSRLKRLCSPLLEPFEGLAVMPKSLGRNSKVDFTIGKILFR
jgi:hypothetical protein